MKIYLQTFLRGIGQVMFQNNAWTGLLFLAGIFYNSWLLGLGALLGGALSNIFAVLFRYRQKEIHAGLYGFNGALLGIAVWFYCVPNLASTLAIIFGAALTTWLMHFFKQKIPSLTAPFVLSAWLTIFALRFFNLATFNLLATTPQNHFDLFSSLSLGLGQVMFQANFVTGIIFLIAILLSSRRAAFYASYGALVGALLGFLFSLPLESLNLGLFGYNAVLCAIALGEKKWSAFGWANLAIILSVALIFVFQRLQMVALTAPFVLATWAILFSKKTLSAH
ncbi:MAG: urea transporter [Patescibacteria group bacterium]